VERVLISVIGRNEYREVKYIYNGKSKVTNVAMSILYDEIQPKKVYILGTETSSWEYIDQLNISYERIIIPYGVQNEDYIQIFKTIANAMDVKDKELYIDVTHGFRSIPFYIFTALNYFSLTQNAKIKGCYYGMLQPGQQDAPIVDMQSLMELQSWIGAYHVFSSSGNATEIAKLLAEKQDEIYRNGDNDRKKPTKLKNLASALNHLSNAIGLNYTKEIIEIATSLLEDFNKKDIQEEIEGFAKPFSMIVPMLVEDLKNIVHHQYVWEIQLFLAKLYYRYKRYTNCLTTLRELIITYLIEIVERKPEYVYDREYREQISRKIYEAAYEDYKKGIKENYGNIIDLRNASGHCGMREDGLLKLTDAEETIQNKVKTIEFFLKGSY